MNNALGLTFTLLMVNAPLLLVAIYRPRRLAKKPLRDEPVLRRLLAALVATTLAANAVAVLMFVLAPTIARHLWAMFFPLWFGLAMPFLMKRYPALAGMSGISSGTRSASLRPRQSPTVSRSACLVVQLGLIAVAVATGVAVALSYSTIPESEKIMALVFSGGTIVAAMAAALLGPWVLRQVVREPQPLDASATETLRREWARFTRVKSLVLLGCLVAVPVVFSIVTLLVVASVSPATVVWVGAGSGVAIGLAGAAMGVWLGTWQASLVERAAGGARPDTAGSTGKLV